MRPIKINPKMRGVFTKKAKRKKMSVQKYANYVIKKYKGKKKTKKQLKLLRQAVFAKTAKKWKKRKKTRKKRGGAYSNIAKKLLKYKTRRKISKTEPQVRKIQQAYRDYRERKMENERFTDQNWKDLKDAYNRSADDMLAPPKKDYSKMTYEEMRDDDDY